MSDRDAIDLFLGDMASHQAATSREVTAPANHRLAVPLFEKLDQKEAEASHRISPAPRPDPVAPVRASDIEAKKRGFTIDRRELPDVATQWSEADQIRAAATRRRLELLLGKVERGPVGQPSWAERLRAILVEQIVNPAARTEVARKVNDLIGESELTFGSIFAERPRRIQVG
jgi:hypothetical protein